jgi:hypothetical protein
VFDKILIADRAENARGAFQRNGRAAGVSAQPDWQVRAAHAGDLDAVEKKHV